MATELGFDPDALHEKYLVERNRRLRDDGNAQYIDVSGAFADYAADPYADAGFDRLAIDEETDAVVLGGGLTGLMTAVSLREEGIERFRIIEQAGDFGGTWYWNRYPGIRCDIESYIYMPLLEEVGTIPSEKYARGHEILEHCRQIGRKYDLYDSALFQTIVESIRWDNESGRWIIKTNRGDSIRARHVLAGSGPLNRPKLPGIEGIKTFRGPTFHTSRWNYDYTGGNSSGGLTGLAGKKVALIGTGATGIQVLPNLAEYAERVYVFQRTPSSVDVRNNQPTDVEWFKNQPSGWQQRRMDNFMLNVIGVPQRDNDVDDGWTDITTVIAELSKLDNPIVKSATPDELMQLADYVKMEQIRARIGAVVKDPVTAEALKPWYNLFCKRPLFSDEYLEVFNKPNVILVDTQGKGVDRLTETALIVNGEIYDVDCIIFATGFRAAVYTHESGGYELIGRDGVTLKERWDQGVRSLHGTQTHLFPNFHIVGSLNQSSGIFNFPHVAARQAKHAAQIVAWCLKNGVKAMEVGEDAEQQWAEEMARTAIDRRAFEAECTPGYYNNEGKTQDRKSLFSGFYGGGPEKYIELIDDWRSSKIDHDASLIYQ